MKITIVLFLLIFPWYLFSQTVLLEQNVKGDTILETHGPNMKHYNYVFVEYGLFAMQSESATAKILIAESGDFSYGFRYKRRLNNFYSVGYDVGYNYIFYKIRQSDIKSVPDTNTYSKEYLRFHNFSVGLYNRFNFGRRGNVLGKFIDLGVYGNLCFSTSHVMKNRNVANVNYRNNKITETNLKYVQPYQYGVVARVGINRFVIYSKYRLSDLFKPKYEFAELPGLIIGVQVGLF